MAERTGFLGGVFNNDLILWFIIVFLILFWTCGGFNGIVGGANECC